MDLSTIKRFLAEASPLFSSVNRFKSRTFWFCFMTWLAFMGLGVVAIADNVDVGVRLLGWALWPIIFFLVKSISTDIREVFIERSSHRLQERLAEVEVSHEVAKIQLSAEIAKTSPGQDEPSEEEIPVEVTGLRVESP